MDNKSEPSFEEWVRLYNEEPEKFEQLRREMIQKIIENSPDVGKKRLEGLQWQIDQFREKSKNPMSSCIKISSMMWDTVLGDEGLIENIEKLAKPSGSVETSVKSEPATVLPFKTTKHSKTEISDSNDD